MHTFPVHLQPLWLVGYARVCALVMSVASEYGLRIRL